MRLAPGELATDRELNVSVTLSGQRVVGGTLPQAGRVGARRGAGGGWACHPKDPPPAAAMAQPQAGPTWGDLEDAPARPEFARVGSLLIGDVPWVRSRLL